MELREACQVITAARQPCLNNADWALTVTTVAGTPVVFNTCGKHLAMALNKLFRDFPQTKIVTVHRIGPNH